MHVIGRIKEKTICKYKLGVNHIFCACFYVNGCVSFDCVVHHMLPPILKEKKIKRSNKIFYQLQKKIKCG
jgi:hypothetical protein